MKEYGTIEIKQVYGVAYDMEFVGRVPDGFGFEFPVFKSEHGYQLDLGGAFGLCDPVEFANDAEAMREIASSIGGVYC